MAYRDRWQIPDCADPLGPRLGHTVGMDQRMDHRRAEQAIAAITNPAPPTSAGRPVGRPGPVPAAPTPSVTASVGWDDPAAQRGPTRDR